MKGSTTPYNHQPIVSCEAVHAKNTFSTKQTTHSDKYTDISLILDCLHLRAFRNFRTPALNPFQIEDVPPTFTKPIFYIPALSGLLLFYLQQKEIPKNPSNIAWKLPLKIKKHFNSYLEVSWIFGLPSGYVNIAIENGVEIVVVFPLKAWWIFPVRETLTRGYPNNQITGFLWISMDDSSEW